MTLEELIARFRVDAMDTVTNPPLFLDEWITDWINDAVTEAVIRGRLLYESQNPAICQIPVSAGVTGYPLHPALYELVSIKYLTDGDTYKYPMDLMTREDLNRVRPDWRNDEPGRPCFLIQDDTRVTVHPEPDVPGMILLEGYRLPLKPMAGDSDKPEINAAHHRHLVHWALHRAFSRPDSETIDPQRAATALAEFTRYFGIRPDSDLRRATRSDEPQTNKAFWI